MNTLTTATHEAATPKARSTRRMLDAPTRTLHWLMALCFVGAYATADGERWRLVHVTLGYTLAGLLPARVLWNLLGPRSSRLSNWWHRLHGARAWLAGARQGQLHLRQVPQLGLAASVVGLLALTVPLTLSGLAMDLSGLDDGWLEELHELAGNTMLTVVLLHAGLLLVLSGLRRRNLIVPMVTGRSEGAGPDLVQHPRRGVAALVLAAVLGFWGWQWHSAPASFDLLHGDFSAQSHHHRHHHDED